MRAMAMVMVRWLPFSWLVTVGAQTCLPNAIPEDQRINISLGGISMPVGIVKGNWESSAIISEIFGILVGDVLGLNVEYGVVGSSSVALLLLAGCPVAVNDFDTDCSQPPRNHFGFEIWKRFTFDPAWLEIVKKMGDAAPLPLGLAGFQGAEGFFVHKLARDRCLDNKGWHLTYYGNYNVSWYDPTECLPSVQDVNLSLLEECAAVLDLNLPYSAGNYLAATGDTDGVEDRNGLKAFKCWQGKWWAAPACRSNVPGSCVVSLTSGIGWGWDVMTQQISFHNMPVALGIAAWGNWIALNMDLKGLQYWWKPDLTFVSYDPQRVVFPPHDPAEYEQGILGSESQDQDIIKHTVPGMDTAANRAVAIARNLELFNSDISKQLLMHLEKTGTNATWTTWDTACQWLSENIDSIDWIPDKTECPEGKGMIDEQEDFVSNRSVAVDCITCPAGRASLAAAAGSRECALCDPGFAQKAFGAAACDPCPEGTYSDVSGKDVCSPCGLGTYANSTGSKLCHVCGAGTGQEELWTTSQVVASRSGTQVIQVQGAYSDSECSCSEGTFLWKGRCYLCAEGSTCLGNNQLVLKPGYFSSSDAPGEIFRCTSNSICPGGPPDTCASGRDAQTVACSSCLAGLSEYSDGTCTACDGGDYALVLVIVVVALLCIAIVYLSLVQDSRNKSPGSTMIVVVGLTQFATSVQMFAVVRRFGISWREPFAGILTFLEILSFDIESFSLSCVTTTGPVVIFILRALVMPVLALMALAIHLCYLAVTRSFKDFKVNQLLRTIGTLFMIFFIILFTMLLAPFQCSSHPNGRYTVQVYPSVFCNGEDEHLQLFIAGGLACLMPILFLAVCTWIVLVEIPRRIAASDAGFLDKVSFLVKRFRPGAEIFSVFFLLRNACVVLCPLALAMSSKILLMSIVLYANLILVSYFKPWRFPVCNLLDIVLTVGMMMVLDVGSSVVNDVDTTTISVLVTFFVAIMLAAILGTMGFGFYRHWQQKYRKQFKFFLCHQKAGAGSMARLLKMELEKQLRGTRTFVDCDDLNDLSRLFSYVGQDTETFVILGSPAIFTRKWCVGEMVTARRAMVDSVILGWPQLEMPHDAFIENYTSLVPDINELTKYGIGLEEIHETLRWLNSLELQPVHGKMTPENVTSMVRSLAFREPPGGSKTSWMKMTLRTGSSANLSKESRLSEARSSVNLNISALPVLVDPDNMEAGACAHVLSTLLRPKLVGTHVPLPSMLHEGMEVIPTSKVALLICSENCFRSVHVQKWLLQCQALPECAMIPVISEDGFAIPTPQSLQELTSSTLEAEELHLYTTIIKAIFQEIAVVFVPQNYSSTQEDLELRARKAAMRITASTLTPLADKVSKLRRMKSTTADVKSLQNEELLESDEGDMNLRHVPSNESEDPLNLEKL